MPDQAMSTTRRRAERSAARQALGAIARCHRAEGERALEHFRARRAAEAGLAAAGLPRELGIEPEALGKQWDRAYAVFESGVHA